MELAIIIPAYKSEFLDKTLNSLVNQTDRNFNVYIGDDCSPYQIKKIVDQYVDKLNIIYKRFDTNLGGVNLVGQWERCISMCRDEEWFWLFSDDDVMERNCVAEFKKYTILFPQTDIFHFNVNVTDAKDKLIHESVYPSIISAKDLYIGKLKGRLDCYVVEFIFKKSVYNEYGGFVNFDLAWGSDLATWINFGLKYGIRTIPTARINWRASGSNISTITSEDILIRKTKALLEFLEWGENTFQDKIIRKTNNSGLIQRLSNMACSSNFSFGFPFIKRYSIKKSEFILMSSYYTMLFLAKFLKNVFQRKIS